MTHDCNELMNYFLAACLLEKLIAEGVVLEERSDAARDALMQHYGLKPDGIFRYTK
ncbi:MAG: hypothetical protein LUD51_01115 [Clostridia bacterium]|nr:hypothetical protein [Clostridia bacterium]